MSRPATEQTVLIIWLCAAVLFCVAYYQIRAIRTDLKAIQPCTQGERK